MNNAEFEFKRALHYVTNGPKQDQNPQHKLAFYAAFKQATTGDINQSKPSVFDFIAKAKWDAWNGLKGLTKEAAMKKYVATLEETAPSWRSWEGLKDFKPGNANSKPTEKTQAVKAQQAPVSVAAVHKSPFATNFLAGKVAFVSGGGSGIGRGITKALLQHGANVVIMSRSIERLEKASAELMEEVKGSVCYPIAADVRDPKAIEAAVDKALLKFGKIDILVNGAAGNFLALAEKMSYNAFKTVVEIDLLGTFNLTKAVYTKAMKVAKSGSIINLSMTLHWTGSPMQSHAGAAKAGIDAITKHLALEFGLDNVRINGIAIGPIEGTEGMTKLLPKPLLDEYKSKLPLQRFGTAQDIGETVLFLSSDAASFITGSVVTVDGGSWMTTGGVGYPAGVQMMRSKL